MRHLVFPLLVLLGLTAAAAPAAADIPFVTALLRGGTFHVIEASGADADDLALVRTSTLQLVESGDPRSGDRAEWSNPATGRSGYVLLIQPFTYDAMDCWQIEQGLGQDGAGEVEVYENLRCRTADGSWKSL